MTDRDAIVRLLATEHRCVRAYGAILRSGALSGRAEEAIRLFGDQERRHVDALELALKGMGTTVPRAPSGQEQIRGGSRRLIQIAIEHERESIRAYDRALAALKAPALLSTAAGAMANQAQHLAFLRQLLGDQPSPVAFVTGK